MAQKAAKGSISLGTALFAVMKEIEHLKAENRRLKEMVAQAHDALQHLFYRREPRSRVLPLCLLCAEAGWTILIIAWLRLERAYLKLRLFSRV